MPAKKPTREKMPLYFFIALLTFFSACGLLGSDDDKEPLEPGPRNYEWTVDSVYSAPGGWMNTIWGSSPDDVWIASSGGYEKLWHFDGEEWSPYPDRFVGDFYSIYGFAQDDVWMGGGDGELWHYNGTEWKLFYTYNPEGLGGPNIFDIWGTSPSDIYAVGTVPTGLDNPSYIGFVLHYDGNQWKELLATDFGMQFQRIRKSKEELYIYGFGPYSTQTIPDSTTIYKYKNKNLKEFIYIPRDGSENRLWLNKIGNDIVILNEKKLQCYSNGNYKSIAELTGTDIVYSFFARHKKDIFLVTSEGLLHYNGMDTEVLYDTGAQPSAVLLEKDVFFFKNDYEAGTNVIYHGTLTENEEEEE